MQGENYEKYEQIRRKHERDGSPMDTKGIPKQDIPPLRPAAMRAWLNKWDPQFNTEYKTVGSNWETRGEEGP